MPCDWCQGNGCLHCEREEERHYDYLSLEEFKKRVRKCPNNARIRINGNDIWVDWDEARDGKVEHIIIKSDPVILEHSYFYKKPKKKKKRHKKLTAKGLYKIATTWPKKMRL